MRTNDTSEDQRLLRRPRFVLAGTNSGVGKTTFTLGLMAALQQRRLRVQGYKAGPDYIDPSYHTAVTGRVSRNLDTWMLSKEAVMEIYLRSSADADVSVIEGVMGFYDGKDPKSNAGSTAELSTVLQAPVVLIVNVGQMARSAAAIVKGFQRLDETVHIAGVLANHVGSYNHFELVKEAIEQECTVPVFGYLPKRTDIQIPDRHLGLIPAIERGELRPLFDSLADAMEQTVDLDGLLAAARSAPDLMDRSPVLFRAPKTEVAGAGGSLHCHHADKPIKIAIAKDTAFNFYYPENLELLEHYGAQLLYFSPLAGELIPDEADGLYLGGGFPEEFAGRLSESQTLLEQVHHHIAEGLPTFAECGGYMFLSQSITDLGGNTYSMVGLVPVKVTMQPRLAALGYREVTALTESILFEAGEKARGHEFHYSAAEPAPFALRRDSPVKSDGTALTADGSYGANPEAAYQVTGRFGHKPDGFVWRNMVAGYTHLHFASNPRMARRFVASCRDYRENGGSVPSTPGNEGNEVSDRHGGTYD
ncbi:cobyrinate a,c-diamide synthase [Alicyclobacillus sp. ALC3]|uniref:cobyrinate a,c-diamide synthase n=1 Tax=Alicyclobacillus sp. ALC3 TaxID=2796143 RepID=UPI0023798193|nr:cobyrinate a,c-diamide synthase [Alicyclobacillus sp. ALC3]